MTQLVENDGKIIPFGHFKYSLQGNKSHQRHLSLGAPSMIDEITIRSQVEVEQRLNPRYEHQKKRKQRKHGQKRQEETQQRHQHQYQYQHQHTHQHPLQFSYTADVQGANDIAASEKQKQKNGQLITSHPQISQQSTPHESKRRKKASSHRKEKSKNRKDRTDYENHEISNEHPIKPFVSKKVSMFEKRKRRNFATSNSHSIAQDYRILHSSTAIASDNSLTNCKIHAQYPNAISDQTRHDHNSSAACNKTDVSTQRELNFQESPTYQTGLETDADHFYDSGTRALLLEFDIFVLNANERRIKAFRNTFMCFPLFQNFFIEKFNTVDVEINQTLLTSLVSDVSDENAVRQVFRHLNILPNEENVEKFLELLDQEHKKIPIRFNQNLFASLKQSWTTMNEKSRFLRIGILHPGSRSRFNDELRALHLQNCFLGRIRHVIPSDDSPPYIDSWRELANRLAVPLQQCAILCTDKPCISIGKFSGDLLVNRTQIEQTDSCHRNVKDLITPLWPRKPLNSVISGNILNAVVAIINVDHSMDSKKFSEKGDEHYYWDAFQKVIDFSPILDREIEFARTSTKPKLIFARYWMDRLWYTGREEFKCKAGSGSLILFDHWNNREWVSKDEVLNITESQSAYFASYGYQGFASPDYLFQSTYQMSQGVENSEKKERI